MSNASDFIIENGVLKKYVGPGGELCRNLRKRKQYPFRGGIMGGNTNEQRK